VTALGKLFRTTAFKISLIYLLITAIGAGLVLGRVGWNVKALIDEQIVQTVDADITGLSEQYAEGGIRRLVDAIERRTREPGAGLYLVTTFAGEPIAGNIASLPLNILTRPGAVETTYQRPGDTQARHRALARIFALPGGFRLLVGHDLEEGERLRQILGGALLASLFWLVLIGTLGGLWVARRVLHRVDAINANAQRIVAGDLSGRLPLGQTGDELDRLVQNLNAMLDKICELMAGLKDVSDNIAHDLKTPLTRLRGGAEEALRFARTPEDYQLALTKVIEESDRLIHIFDALLMIARAEAGSGREGMADFDAALVAADLFDLYEPVADDRGISLVTKTEPGLYVHGSRELIGQAIANLLDNAIKYGAPEEACTATGKRLELIARRAHADIEIVVADQGPGIDEKDRARVLERFVRLENSRSRPGSGLGLSLVAAVAHLHNGALVIEDNEPGLRVILRLPGTPVQLALPAPIKPEPEAAFVAPA
jgi:signal transduction histidine kinase